MGLQRAIVDASRAEHRGRRLEHRLLDSRHGQRCHGDLFTMEHRRAVGRAHVEVVADQVLALTRWVTPAAQCHANSRQHKRPRERAHRVGFAVDQRLRRIQQCGLVGFEQRKGRVPVSGIAQPVR